MFKIANLNTENYLDQLVYSSCFDVWFNMLKNKNNTLLAHVCFQYTLLIKCNKNVPVFKQIVTSNEKKKKKMGILLYYYI